MLYCLTSSTNMFLFIFYYLWFEDMAEKKVIKQLNGNLSYIQGIYITQKKYINDERTRISR